MKGTRSAKSVTVLLLLAVFLTVGLLLGGCGGDDEATETTAGGSATSAGGTETTGGAAPTGGPGVIGAIVSATGPGAALGEQERNVLEMMQEQLNAAGGVLGRPVEIVIEDDKSDPKEAVTAANRLIDQEKAVALIAATISPSTLAVKEITAQKGLPQMAMAAANDITDKAPMEWIWRTPHKDALAVARALTYISENLGLTTSALREYFGLAIYKLRGWI
jgi:branched-chain amino acid transport system substrate-binding protein